MARGDHIRARRPGYWHHGIDCGDGSVIHYTGELVHRKNACVQRAPMEDFAKGGRVEVVRHAECSDVDEVMARAESRLGESAYRVLTNNCEHFARWCKTGRPGSRQVLHAFQAAGAVCIGLGVLAVGVAGAKLAARFRNDEASR